MTIIQDRKAALQAKSVRISCVVPVYNEQEVVAPFVAKLAETLAGLASDFEIILVDAISTDKTFEIAKEYEIKCEYFKAYQNEIRVPQIANILWLTKASK